MPEKKKIKLCSASRMTFRAWFYRTDPQNIGGQFGTLSGFMRDTFRKRTSQKSPEIYFRPKSFRTIFEKRTPVYSFAAPLLGLAKSIYYSYYTLWLFFWRLAKQNGINHSYIIFFMNCFYMEHFTFILFFQIKKMAQTWTLLIIMTPSKTKYVSRVLSKDRLLICLWKFISMFFQVGYRLIH